jgi:hypothetical protein
MKKTSLLFLLLTLTLTQIFGDEVIGKVSKTGMSGIIMENSDGIEIRYLSGKKSQYTPADWRPQAGDEIKITYTEQVARDGVTAKLVMDSVELIKLDPANVPLESPQEGIISNPGKKSIDIKVGDKVVKFEKNRKTRIEPTGAVLSPGQKVTIEFTPTPARMGNARIINVIDKITIHE